MENQEFEPISIRIVPKSFILKEILSRVVDKRRNEFVKEAIFYWDYIIRHSKEGSWHLSIDEKEKIIVDNLFPKSYFINRKNPDHSVKDKYEKVQMKPLRFDIGSDEIELQKILSRVSCKEDFIKEAIFEWDCLINTSNIFVSRFIRKKDNAITEWHLPIQNNNSMDTDTIQSSSNKDKDTISSKEEVVNKNVGKANTIPSKEEIDSDCKEKSDIDNKTTSNITEEKDESKKEIPKVEKPKSNPIRVGAQNSLKW